MLLLGFLNDEGHALALMDVVKGQTANVGIWVSLLALIDLTQDLGWIRASKHWQLPQCPISTVVITRHLVVATMNMAHLQHKLNTIFLNLKQTCMRYEQFINDHHQLFVHGLKSGVVGSEILHIVCVYANIIRIMILNLEEDKI